MKTEPQPAEPIEAMLPLRRLTAEDLAAVFGRDRRSVLNMAARGDLPPPFRFCGKWTWLAGAIQEHLRGLQDKAFADVRRKPVDSEKNLV